MNTIASVIARTSRHVLAAVLAVLMATRSAAPAGLPAERPRTSQWTEHSRAQAVSTRPGQHSWRASALPR